LVVEALEILQGIARNARTTWHGQWDGRYVAVVDANHGADVEVQVLKLGSVTRYRCASKDVLILDPHSTPIDARTIEVLRELRLLPRVEANGIVVVGPQHVLESAAARLRMRGTRTSLHGRELRVVRP
jgi:ABC-type transport system involved in cytochrome c biogenesis ATPase subunit